MNIKRCGWPSDNLRMIKYHDTEWGVPVHNDRRLFEFMILDAFQAGLNWRIILDKRTNFRKAFHNFNARKIARYTRRDVQRLLKDPAIIRNRAKIAATIENARQFLKIKKEFGSFDRYIWQFVGGKTKKNKFKRMGQIPAKSKESDAMSKDLYERGFRFVGSTICYAFMQAAGMINDHVVDCFRYNKLTSKSAKKNSQRRVRQNRY